MRIEKIMFDSFKDCYECTVDNKKLIVVADIGPRILSLTINGSKNILFFDDQREHFYKGWYLYGGSRLWIGPETSDTYSHDNEKCEVVLTDDCISVFYVDKSIGLKKTITVMEKNNNFLIRHTIENITLLLKKGSIWSLTCVKPEGTVFIPWSNPGSEWNLNKIIFWESWLDHTTNINSKQYVKRKDLLLIKPTGEEGKVGTCGYEGFIGITNDNYTFIKKFHRELTNSYPDDNCAIECYTNKEFIELETLSPYLIFYPNVPVHHDEEWIIVNKKVDTDNIKGIRKIL